MDIRGIQVQREMVQGGMGTRRPASTMSKLKLPWETTEARRSAGGEVRESGMLRVVASVPQAKLRHARFHASELVLVSRTRTANAVIPRSPKQYSP